MAFVPRDVFKPVALYGLWKEGDNAVAVVLLKMVAPAGGISWWLSLLIQK